MEDNEIVELYLKRDEAAISQTERKYGRLCFRITHNILSSAEDSEECANDTLLNTWNSIPPAKPRSLKAFVARIARNIALTRFKFNTRQKRARSFELSIEELEECVPDNRVPARDTELSEALDRFLGTLSADARRVFVRRYWYFDSVKDIAERFSFSESKVNNLLFRTRKSCAIISLRRDFSYEGI